MDKTAFGDRMKTYEAREAQRRLMPLLPVVARLDGKAFSKFTKGLGRPYDARMSRLMQGTAVHLLKSTVAIAAYTQSDEITLVYASDDIERPIYLDGRIQKLVSILAASATAYFCRELADVLPEKADQMPLFDCRVWSVPTKTEAANTVLWRVKDAIRNSVSMAAQAEFPHDVLHGKSRAAMQAMLVEQGVDWDAHPDYFKWGTLFRRVQIKSKFSAEEIADLPEKHAARRDPELVVSRTDCLPLEVNFGDVRNRVEVLFDGADPVTTA